MATKNKQQHLGNREDYQDAAAYLDEYGTLEGWEAPVGATYKTGEELMDFWKGAGVDKNNDGTLSREELQPQMDATLQYWNAKPKRSKMSAISEEVRRTLPYVAAVAPFAAPGSVLGSIAKGTSSLGKWGQLMTGGGNFSKNPMVNMLIKQAISKAAGGAGMDTLGSVMKMGSMGHGAADMLDKGIYAPEKTKMPGSMEDYWKGIGEAGEAANAAGKPITDANKYDWMESNFPGSITGGGYDTKTGRPLLTGAGGTKPGGGFGGGASGSGMNPVAMGLMTSLLGKAFEGDNKPAPAPAPAPTGGAGLPTYGSLIGMATNRDAMEDQRNRLKFGGRTA